MIHKQHKLQREKHPKKEIKTIKLQKLKRKSSKQFLYKARSMKYPAFCYFNDIK